MRHPSFLGQGGQACLSPTNQIFPCGATGGAPDAPAAFCGNTRGPSCGFLFPPMLFARKALASGPQACFLEENAIAIVKVDKRKFLPEKI